jgi:hypothetical protein
MTCGERVEYVRIEFDNWRPEPTKLAVRLRTPQLCPWPNFTVTGNAIATIRRSVHFAFPERGQYDVRFKRTSPDVSGNAGQHSVYLSRILAFRKDFPMNLDGACLLALRIKATDQLNGPIDNLSCRAKALLPAWTGSAWTTPAATSSPAWAFADVLRGSSVKHPLADNRIDLAALKSWAETCAGLGLQFDGVFDSRMTRYEALRTIANVGMAEPAMPEGLYTVVVDRVRSGGEIASSPIFTPRNSRDLSVERSYAPIPHAIRAKFLNELADFQEDQRIVYMDSYDETNATEFQELELFGVKHPDQVYKLCRWRLAELSYRRDSITLKTDIEGLAVLRGDLARVNSDVSMWGLAAFRIKTATRNGNTFAFVFDDEYTMEGGKAYQFVFRYEDGDFLTALAPTIAGTFNTVTLDGFIEGVIPDPQPGDLVVFGEQNASTRTCLVREIEREDDHNATVSLVRYDPAMYAAAFGGEIPPFDSGITIPPERKKDPPAPVILQLRSDETVMTRDQAGRLVACIVIDLRIPGGYSTSPDQILVQYRCSEAGAGWMSLAPLSVDSREVSISPVNEGESYDVRARTITFAGRTSAWTEVDGHVVVGRTTPPPDVSSAWIEMQTVLVWRYPSPPVDFAGFLVRVAEGTDQTWGTAGILTDLPIVETRYHIGSVRGGVKTFLVKAIDTTGNESVNACALTADMGDPAEENVAWEEDEKADAFPGVIESGAIDAGDLAALSNEPFWTPHDAAFWLPHDATFWIEHYGAMAYQFACKPPDEFLPARIWLDATVQAKSGILYRANRATLDEQFGGVLADNWNTPEDGTWAIVGGILEVTHRDAGNWNQRMRCKTDLGAAGTRRFTSMRVKVDSAAASRFGIMIAGRYCEWQIGTYWIGSTPDTTTHAMQDGVWEEWLFEITEDGRILWFVDGALACSGTIASSDVAFYLAASKRSSPTPVYKYYFDDVRVWDEGNDWRPWLGEIEMKDGADILEWRIETAAGPTQGRISVLTIKVDVPTIRERFENVSIAAGGTRLTLTESYRFIRTVLATVLHDGGTGMYAKAMDRDSALGPMMKIFDSTGTAVGGRISVDVEGY